MKALIITQAENQQLNDNLFQVLTAAQKITTHCDVLVLGQAELTQLNNLLIVKNIFVLTNLTTENSLSSHIADSLAQYISNYSHVLMAADSFGKDLLPRIAGILDLGQISEVVDVISPNIFKKPMYAGNIVAEIESLESIKLLTVRPTSFAIYQEQGATCQINTQTLELSATPIELVKQELIYSDTIDLSHAQIIVTGGRSLGSLENFEHLIHGLALKLGGAVGASRAAVEAGYANNDCQIGQTGKVVAPKLYLAIGISGAVQHIAGMKDSKTVVAINLDPNAQIFEYADYGLVGDLFDIVPELINCLK
ncbi:MAG: hypothetical protein RLZZ293_371 [Pseudomonadota bacterium]|jgi:electron transfer flavoprotein alpha subunit